MKILVNYHYELYPFTTASYIDMAIARRDDLILLHRDDLREHKPDYIINIEPVPHICAMDGVPSCYWEIDNHVILGVDHHWYKGVDIVLLAQNYFKPWYENYNTADMPLAADPTVHRRYKDEKIKWQLGLLGNDTYPERRKLLNILAQKYSVLMGTEEPGEPYSRKLNQCEIVFNRSMNLDINMRVFEGISCGRLVITDDLPQQNKFFKDGTHFVTYATTNELLKKVEYYLTHDDEREKIAYAGMVHAHAHHTYDKRLCQIIQILDSLKLGS